MRKWPRSLLILDTIKCPAENKEGVVMASNRVRGGASYSVAEESPCAVVTSELRPKGQDGAILESRATSGFGLRGQELQDSSQNSSRADGCLNVLPVSPNTF